MKMDLSTETMSEILLKSKFFGLFFLLEFKIVLKNLLSIRRIKLNCKYKSI